MLVRDDPRDVARDHFGLPHQPVAEGYDLPGADPDPTPHWMIDRPLPPGAMAIPLDVLRTRPCVAAYRWRDYARVLAPAALVIGATVYGIASWTPGPVRIAHNQWTPHDPDQQVTEVVIEHAGPVVISRRPGVPHVSVSPPERSDRLVHAGGKDGQIVISITCPGSSCGTDPSDITVPAGARVVIGDGTTEVSAGR